MLKNGVKLGAAFALILLLLQPVASAYESQTVQDDVKSIKMLPIGCDESGYAFAQIDDTFHYINQWGELLFPKAGVESGENFWSGFAPASENGYFGVIDASGATILPFEYTNAATLTSSERYSSGIALFKNGCWRYLRKDGTLMTELDRNIFPLDGYLDGYAVARDLTSGLSGVLQENGSWAIEPHMARIVNLGQGLFEVCPSVEDVTGNTYGLIDHNGEEWYPPEFYTFVAYEDYGYIEVFDALLPPSLEEGYDFASSVIDYEGNTVIPMQDGIVRVLSEYCFAVHPRDEDAMWSIIDRNGTTLHQGISWIDVWPGIWSQKSDYHLVMFGTNQDEQYIACIDSNGNTVSTLPNEYSQGDMFGFREGLVAYVAPGEDTIKYIDIQGNVQLQIPIMSNYFWNAQDFSEGGIWVVTEDETGKANFARAFNPLAKDYVSSWAEGELAQAESAGLVTESNDSYFTFRITRRRFAELMANLVEKATGQTVTPAPEGTFTDTDDLWVRKAAALGIVNGFGDGRFSPNGYINREQVAAALCRAVRYIEGETGQTVLPSSASLTGYADAGQVSPWAADSMAALTAAGLLQGTSGTTLSPKDTTTVEQGILLALRAYQAFTE